MSECGDSHVFTRKAQADACFRNKQYRQAKTYYLAAIDAVRDMIRIQHGRCAIENCLAFQEERAQLTMSLGSVYEAIEEIKEAEECFHISLSIYREVLERKTELGLDVVQTFLELHKTASIAGNLFYENCDYAKALSFYEMALDSPLPPVIFHRDKNVQGQMDTTSQQQIPLDEKTDADGCRAVEQVNIICNDEKDQEFSQKKMLLCRADMLHNIANVFSVLNDTENSIILYLQAFKLQTEVLGQNDPQVATTLHNVATSYYRAGRYDEAIQRYRQVLKYSSQQENSHHPLTFDALVGIGMTLAKTGEWDQALSVYDAALQIPMRDSRQRAKKAAVYNAIGEIYKETGEEEQALTHFNSSIAIYEAIGLTQDDPRLTTVKTNIKALEHRPCYDSPRGPKEIDMWSLFDAFKCR